MKRVVLTFGALLLVGAILLRVQSWRVADAEMSLRVGQLEEQVQTLKQSVAASSGDEELKSENARLLAENKSLRMELAELKGTTTPKRSGQNTAEPAQAAPHDPLAFYRRNPELMKRYFPQLYMKELAHPAQSGEVPNPPADQE